MSWHAGQLSDKRNGREIQTRYKGAREHLRKDIFRLPRSAADDFSRSFSCSQSFEQLASQMARSRARVGSKRKPYMVEVSKLSVLKDVVKKAPKTNPGGYQGQLNRRLSRQRLAAYIARKRPLSRTGKEMVFFKRSENPKRQETALLQRCSPAAGKSRRRLSRAHCRCPQNVHRTSNLRENVSGYVYVRVPLK